MKSGDIRSLARQRGITDLYHFTPLGNLQSILINGLLSRETLDERGMPYIYTDDWRNDGKLNAISLSIHGINETMFSQKTRNSNVKWAILEIEASVLWTHRCRFCWVNAASSEIVNHSGYIGGPWAFEQMFAPRPMSAIDNRSAREVFRTPLNMPTMNDAEVQVCVAIEPQLIRDVTVANESGRSAALASMKAAGRSLPVVISPEMNELLRR